MSERTPTETLINVLEDFNGDEPTAIIAIWTTTNGDIAWSISDPRYTQYVGMCEAIAYILKDRIKNMVVSKDE